MLNVYSHHLNSLSSIQPKQFAKELEAALNLIAMYTTATEDDSLNRNIEKISYGLFARVYSLDDQEDFSEGEEERVIVARMMEWAYDHIEFPIALSVIV